MNERSGLGGLIRLSVLVALPIAEIWALIRVGSAIGVLSTIVLLFAMSAAGLWLLRLRLAGFAFSAVTEVVENQKVVPAQVADHALRILGAILLFVPGFITGGLGLSLLIRPLRLALAGVLGTKLRGVVNPLVRQRSRFGYTEVIDVDGYRSDQSSSVQRPAADLPNAAPEA